MVFANQNFNVHAEIAGPSNNFDDASGRSYATSRKSRHLHVNNGAIGVPVNALLFVADALPFFACSSGVNSSRAE